MEPSPISSIDYAKNDFLNHLAGKSQSIIIENKNDVVNIDENKILKEERNKNSISSVNRNILIINDEENDDENASLLGNEQRKAGINPYTNSKKIKCLYLLDIFLSVVLFSPISSFYWYGTWLYLDTFFIPDDYRKSNFISLGIGLVLLFPSYLFQQNLQNAYEYFKTMNIFGNIMRFLMRTIYIYLISFAVVAQWRGLWNLLGIYFFQDWVSQLSLAIIAASYFVLSRSTKSLNSSPFLLYIDDNQNYFTSKSKFSFPVDSQYFQYIVDYSITEIIECFALVVIWRGFENLSDYFIFPNDQLKCLITCFVASHSVYMLIAVIQHFLYEKTSQLNLIFRLIIGDFVHIVMFYSSVLAWKFYWNAIDFYFVTDKNQLFVYIAFHLVPFVASIATLTGSMLVGPTADGLDGEINPDLPCFFELNYLNAIFNENDDSSNENHDDNERLLA